jgi:hypothetical protein
MRNLMKRGVPRAHRPDRSLAKQRIKGGGEILRVKPTVHVPIAKGVGKVSPNRNS